MANVLFSRTDSPSTKPITDGQIIFDTSGNGKMYLDNGTTRLEMGGAINVDATLDANSTNPIQNKGVAGVMLSELEEVRGVTKKGFLTDALATKTLDAKIGTTDISSIGDGTVTGAISDVNGKLESINENLKYGSVIENYNIATEAPCLGILVVRLETTASWYDYELKSLKTNVSRFYWHSEANGKDRITVNVIVTKGESFTSSISNIGSVSYTFIPFRM